MKRSVFTNSLLATLNARQTIRNDPLALSEIVAMAHSANSSTSSSTPERGNGNRLGFPITLPSRYYSFGGLGKHRNPSHSHNMDRERMSMNIPIPISPREDMPVGFDLTNKVLFDEGSLRV